MALGHVGAFDDDAVSVLQVLLKVRRATATEGGSQTGNCRGVSYAGLVLDLDRTHRRVELLHEVVLLVVEGRSTEAGDAHGAAGAVAVRLPLPELLACRDDPVGDHVHRRLELEVLPLGAEG